MPLMKVRREDDTGWYTVDHLNFNYIGLGVNTPITLVQSNSKAENLNKIYVYDGREYPYDINNPKEELLYKSTMEKELNANWMPKLYEAFTGPIDEDKQKDINIVDSKVYPGRPGTLLLEHRTIIKNKTTQNTTNGTGSGNASAGTAPKCELGNISTYTGEDKNNSKIQYARTDFFDISTVKEIKPKSSVTYMVYVYDKDGIYEGILHSDGEVSEESESGLFSNNASFDESLKTDSKIWSTDKKYRLSGKYLRTSNIQDPNLWEFVIAEKTESPEEDSSDSSAPATNQETFHILNYWDDTNKKWIPLNNIWG